MRVGLKVRTLIFKDWLDDSLGIFLAFLLVVFTLIVWEQVKGPSLDWDKFKIKGGCALDDSPALPDHKLLSLSASTLCRHGKSDQDTIIITFPGELADSINLYVTGLFNTADVSLKLFQTEANKLNIPVTQLDGNWQRVEGSIPADWKSSLVSIELTDQSKTRGAEIGLSPKSLSRQDRVFRLFGMTLAHAIIIVLPMWAGLLIAASLGLRDYLHLALVAFATGGLLAYGDFWLWLLSPNLGLCAGILSLFMCLFFVIKQCKSLPSELAGIFAQFFRLTLLWFCYSLFLLAMGLAPSNLEQPLSAVASRFSHQLPVDNQLPFVFALQITSGHIQSPMSGDWLSSDRPPLQTAYYLLSGTSQLTQADLHYQIVATLLQNLWLVGMWMLLSVFTLSRQARFICLLVLMLCGFTFIHGLFTWPKLLPVVYLATILALFLRNDRRDLADWRVGLGVGCMMALAMLCHGGSLFALLGMALALPMLKKLPSLRFLCAAGIVAVLMFLGWSLYQSIFDPPGNRLLKWHLAGVSDIDQRTTLVALRDSYSGLSIAEILALKWSNIQPFWGAISVWIPLSFKASFGLISDADGSLLRAKQFFNLFAALGPLGLMLPVGLLFAWWRQEKASLQLILIALCIGIVEVLLFFGPEATVIHQSSFMLVCLLFAASVLSIVTVSLRLAWIMLALHLVLTVRLYGFYLPEGQSLGFDQTFWLLPPVALLATIFILWNEVGNISNRLELPMQSL